MDIKQRIELLNREIAYLLANVDDMDIQQRVQSTLQASRHISEEDIAFAQAMHERIKGSTKEQYELIPNHEILKYKQISNQIYTLAEDNLDSILQYVTKNIKSQSLSMSIIEKVNQSRKHAFSESTNVQQAQQEYIDSLTPIINVVTKIRKQQLFMVSNLKIELKMYHDLVLNYLDEEVHCSVDTLAHYLFKLNQMKDLIKDLEKAQADNNVRLSRVKIKKLRKVLGTEFTGILRDMMEDKHNLIASDWIVQFKDLQKEHYAKFRSSHKTYDSKLSLDNYQRVINQYFNKLSSAFSQESSDEMRRKVDKFSADETLSQQRSSLGHVLRNYRENDFIYGLSHGRSGIMGVLAPRHTNIVVDEAGKQKIDKIMMVDDLNNMFLGTGLVNDLQKSDAPGIGQKFDKATLKQLTGKAKDFSQSLAQDVASNPRYYSGDTQVNYRIKQACKHGLYFATKVQKARVHFVLDGINMDWVVHKKGPSDIGKNRDITGAELRFLFRNRGDPDMKNNVIFWKDGKQVAPPWDNNPKLWSEYQIKKAPSDIACKRLDIMRKALKHDMRRAKNPVKILGIKIKLAILKSVRNKALATKNQTSLIMVLNPVRVLFKKDFQRIIARLDRNVNIEFRENIQTINKTKEDYRQEITEFIETNPIIRESRFRTMKRLNASVKGFHAINQQESSMSSPGDDLKLNTHTKKIEIQNKQAHEATTIMENGVQKSTSMKKRSFHVAFTNIKQDALPLKEEAEWLEDTASKQYETQADLSPHEFTPLRFMTKKFDINPSQMALSDKEIYITFQTVDEAIKFKHDLIQFCKQNGVNLPHLSGVKNVKVNMDIIETLYTSMEEKPEVKPYKKI